MLKPDPEDPAVTAFPMPDSEAPVVKALSELINLKEYLLRCAKRAEHEKFLDAATARRLRERIISQTTPLLATALYADPAATMSWINFVFSTFQFGRALPVQTCIARRWRSGNTDKGENTKDQVRIALSKRYSDDKPWQAVKNRAAVIRAIQKDLPLQKNGESLGERRIRDILNELAGSGARGKPAKK